MKIQFNADGSVKTIEDREFLVSGSSGVNILEVFSDYPFEDISKVKAYASFQRADGRVLTNIAMQLAPIEEPTHFELELIDDLGILAISGELQISIKLKFDGKTLANGIVVGKVYRSIGLPDEPDINTYHIQDLQNRVDHLEQGITAETYSKAVIDGKLEGKAAVDHQHPNYLTEDYLPDLSEYYTKSEVAALIPEPFDNSANETRLNQIETIINNQFSTIEARLTALENNPELDSILDEILGV